MTLEVWIRATLTNKNNYVSHTQGPADKEPMATNMAFLDPCPTEHPCAGPSIETPPTTHST